jgi:hypothetical protein
MDKGVLPFVRLKAANNIYRTYKLPQLTTAQSEGQQQSLMESNKQFIEKYHTFGYINTIIFSLSYLY